MKIYFTASVSAGRDYVNSYQNIVKLLSSLGHQVLSKHVASSRLHQRGEKKEPEIIFSREKERINKSDAVVAEVSQPSIGVGFLLGYALQQEKPTLALFFEEAEDLLSPMIEGNPAYNLYLEHYSQDNLRFILKSFLKHVENNNHRQGKLIVIEGGNGSGKKTQLDLLAKYLEKANDKKVHKLDFPQYYSSFHGRIVGRYLSGEFGQLNDINPYLASLAFALDRLSAKDQMDEWLRAGDIILSNRYVPSSMTHQTVKLPKKEQEKYLEWLYELEYKKHKLPLEDVVIYLYVPCEMGLRLIAQRSSRKYLKGRKKDIEEESLHLLKEAEKMYLRLCRRTKHWIKIDCVNKSGQLRSKNSIHREIVKILKRRKLI